MQKAEHTVRSLLIAALIASVLFVVGIPMIILGASGAFGSIGVNRLFLIAGIVFTAGCFYGMPILWITYANARELRRVVFAVEVQRLYTVERLAAHLNLPPEVTRGKLDACFEKGYLPGFIRDGDTLTPLSDVTPENTLHSVECPSCSARFTFEGGNGKCPYCGTVYIWGNRGQ
mgnify:FL=1